jgi:hypothetical protein
MIIEVNKDDWGGGVHSMDSLGRSMMDQTKK